MNPRTFSSLTVLALAFYSGLGLASPRCGFPDGSVSLVATAQQPFRQNLKRMLLSPTLDAVFQSDDLPAWLTIDRDGYMNGTAPATPGQDDFHVTVFCEDGQEDDAHPATLIVR